MKKQYVVRVVCINNGWDLNPFPQDVFLEQLRYAGLIQIVPTEPTINMDGESFDKVCFDLVAPKGVGDSQGWAEGVARRMQSFGYNAVCAPAM